MSWCRDDRKEKTHMKSTRAWAEAPHDFVKKGYKFGVTKRMVPHTYVWDGDSVCVRVNNNFIRQWGFVCFTVYGTPGYFDNRPS